MCKVCLSNASYRVSRGHVSAFCGLLRGTGMNKGRPACRTGNGPVNQEPSSPLAVQGRWDKCPQPCNFCPVKRIPFQFQKWAFLSAEFKMHLLHAMEGKGRCAKYGVGGE